MSAQAGAADRLNTKVLDSLAAIDAAAGAWRDLETRCEGGLTYFQTLSWCRNWVAHFSRAGRVTPHIRTVWRGDVMVAVWPLMVNVGRLGVRRLECLGDPHTQYANMLCDAAEDARTVMHMLMVGLEREARCDVVVLNAVPAHSPLGRVLKARNPRAAEDNAAAILDLSGFASPQAYLDSLGKSQKRNRNRRLNRLSRFGALDFAVLWPGDPDYAAHLATCMAMKRRWLRETGRYSTGFAFRGYEAFLASLEGDAESRTGACLAVLSCDGRAVAAELGFIRHGHFYSYIGGFDWDLRDYSPGKVIMGMVVAWLIENRVSAYDLLGNPADYKQSWSNRAVPLGAHAIARSWRGRIYAGAWLRGLRPAAKRFYGAVPETLRKLATVGQGLGCILLWV